MVAIDTGTAEALSTPSEGDFPGMLAVNVKPSRHDIGERSCCWGAGGGREAADQLHQYDNSIMPFGNSYVPTFVFSLFCSSFRLRLLI